MWVVSLLFFGFVIFGLACSFTKALFGEGKVSAYSAIILVVGGIVAAVYIVDKKKKVEAAEKKEKEKRTDIAIDDEIAKVPEFSCESLLKGTDWAIAFDESRKQILLIDDLYAQLHSKALDYSDIIGSEIIVDGVSVSRTQTNRGSQLLGAAVGTALIGVGGLIVGGLSGKKTTISNDIIKSIKLRVVINDTKNPAREIQFLSVPAGKGSPVYSKAMQDVRHWHDIFEIIIKQADEESRRTVQSHSVADELIKLKELRDSGALSEGEFQQLKGKILEIEVKP